MTMEHLKPHQAEPTVKHTKINKKNTPRMALYLTKMMFHSLFLMQKMRTIVYLDIHLRINLVV